MIKFWQKFKGLIEKILPMRFADFLIFLFVIYLAIIVSRTIWSNYNSNKEIEAEENEVEKMESELIYLQYQINYYQTYSFKEKEAREKLGYKAPGENVLSLPIDKEEDHVADSSLIEASIRVPNYKLWYKYLVED